MAATTKDLVKKFIKLDQQIKKREGEIEKLKDEKKPLEDDLLRRFQEAGMSSMKDTNGVSVYVRRELWASPLLSEGADKQAFYDAIRDLDGVGALVHETVNAQQLSAWVRERITEFFGDEEKKKTEDELVQALPEPMQKITKITEKFSLRCRKG